MDQNQIQTGLVGNWIDETVIAMHSCERSVEEYEKQIELEKASIELYKQRIRLAVDEYNEWARENGVDQMCYPF